MRQLRRFLALPRRDRALLARSFAAVLWTRAALSVLGYARLRELLAARERRPGARAPAVARHPSAARVGWAVKVASRLVPGASCLTQALAAQQLLDRAGRGSELRLGVTRTARGRFRAHAWLESEGGIVIGAHQRTAFVELSGPQRAGA